MSSYQNLPSVNEIKRAAAAGQRFTPEDVSAIAQAESELTGGGPVKGGPAGIFSPFFYTNTGVAD